MVKTQIRKKGRPGGHVLTRLAGCSRLIFVTDRHRVPDPAKVVRRLPKGAIVIFRDYDAPDRAGAARALQQIARQSGVVFLVAGDARLARVIGADGVHLPEYQLFQRPPAVPVISAACHTRRALRRAHDLNIPLKLVSPVFPTRSHAGQNALGIHRFSRLSAGRACGIVALGGINGRTAKRLKPISIEGIAAIDGLAATDLRR